MQSIGVVDSAALKGQERDRPEIRHRERKRPEHLCEQAGKLHALADAANGGDVNLEKRFVKNFDDDS